MAISTTGVTKIKDEWDNFTRKQKNVIRDIRSQSLRFKTLTRNSKQWKVFAGVFEKPKHLARLKNFLGNDMIIWRCWIRSGKDYYLEYDENGDGIGTPVYNGNKNWTQAIAEKHKDDTGTEIDWKDNQEALASMPGIFGQQTRVL